MKVDGLNLVSSIRTMFMLLLFMKAVSSEILEFRALAF